MQRKRSDMNVHVTNIDTVEWETYLFYSALN